MMQVYVDDPFNSFKSYQDDNMLIMKTLVQWNSVYGRLNFRGNLIIFDRKGPLFAAIIPTFELYDIEKCF